MKASVVAKLAVAVGFLFGTLSAAQTPSTQSLPEAPGASAYANQHYERGTELYGEYQHKCSELNNWDCGLNEKNGTVAEYRQAKVAEVGQAERDE